MVMVAELPKRSGAVSLTEHGVPVLVRLRLIGQMEAWTFRAENVMPHGRKTRALLAVLALSAPRPVLRGRLAELLWSRRPDEQARASLRQEIHRLGEALAPVEGRILAVSRDHLMLRPGTVWMDVEEVLRATPERPAGLSLVDGELLEDLDGVDAAFDAWREAERERFKDGARALAEQLLRQTSGPASMIAAAQQLLTIDRAHEGAWRALMRAYAERGERGMAIQAYDRCRAVLADRLDANPSEETQLLVAEIRAAAPPSPPASPPPRLDPRVLIRGQPRQEVRHEARAETRGQSSRAAPRVGVLPLQLIGDCEADSSLSHGLADEITSALARFRWMFLVSSGALAQFAVQSRDETAIRRSLGLDFLLDGSLQRVGERLRVALRLLDLRAGNQVVWSRRFDQERGDLLTLQDDIAAEVVAQVESEIARIEAHRVSGRPAADPTAYELMLRARPLLWRLDREGFLHAGELLRRAVEMEPDSSAAHTDFALWHILLFSQAWARDPARVMVEAGVLANRAVMLDPQDARALTIAGHVRARLHRHPGEALTLHERALTVNPNLVVAWALSAAACAYLGDLDEAGRRMQRYKKLSPLDPRAFFFDTTLVLVALLKHDHEAAAAIGRQVSVMNPAFTDACKPCLAALGLLGRSAAAAETCRHLMSLEPDFSIARFLETSPFDQAEHRAHFVEGLRLAGVPEGRTRSG
jgi:DNA-binding SARP family transcriptional activator